MPSSGMRRSVLWEKRANAGAADVITGTVTTPSAAVSYVLNALNTFPKGPVSQSAYVRIRLWSMKMDPDTARHAGAVIICSIWFWRLALRRTPEALERAFVSYQEERPSRIGADIKALVIQLMSTSLSPAEADSCPDGRARRSS